MEPGKGRAQANLFGDDLTLEQQTQARQNDEEGRSQKLKKWKFHRGTKPKVFIMENLGIQSIELQRSPSNPEDYERFIHH